MNKYVELKMEGGKSLKIWYNETQTVQPGKPLHTWDMFHINMAYKANDGFYAW